MKVLATLLAAVLIAPASLYAQELPPSSEAITPISGTVDLLWQGEVYTPPFYRGKALWGRESRVTLVAIPHIPGKDPAKLYYRWSRNDEILSISGVGRNVLTLADPVYSLPADMRIDIMTAPGEGVLATEGTALTPVLPHSVVYEESPAYGVLFNAAVGNKFAFDKPEVTFTAFPLYSGVTTRTAPAMSYSWTTGSGAARTGQSVTYRIPDGTEGSANIRLETRNSRTLTQPYVKDFLVQFGQQAGL